MNLLNKNEFKKILLIFQFYKLNQNLMICLFKKQFIDFNIIHCICKEQIYCRTIDFIMSLMMTIVTYLQTFILSFFLHHSIEFK